jgi:hypothetical protein
MLAKCANPACSAIFRTLQRGRLFRREGKSPDGKPAEYFWLCDCCASKSTLRLNRDGGIRIWPVPDPAANSSDEPDPVASDRHNGMQLTRIDFHLDRRSEPCSNAIRFQSFSDN